ncbi:MAG: threonine--tRNA ligase [Parcubacteria group bacterium RIFOXYD2_FULL_52_8]|nr:MAG: threonine--tRNA ligase [Parcubacteria group bacterium RIFOXYD2_FULL_52_8]
MDKQKLEGIRHSLAHLLATSIIELYPGAENAIGPALEDGFYQEFELPQPISEKDFPAIEKKMREKLNEWKKLKHFSHREVTADEAREQFKWNKYKTELINDFEREGKKITFYTLGNFIDLCKGGHEENCDDINLDAVKLDRVAGAYWKGNEKNIMLTRIYGFAFESKEKLHAHLAMLEEAKKRDHRLLGKQLNLFTFDEKVGLGLVLWLPNGEAIRHELEAWARATEKKWGYQHVSTPHITKGNLYEISGHLPYYKDDLYSPFEIEGEAYYLKPMNCPHTHMIYQSAPHSYRELPIRYAEYGQVYRFERSGTLHGLMRTRGFCQNDAHIYVQPEDAVNEFLRVFEMHKYYYDTLGIKDWWVVLGVRDPKNLRAKYHGDDNMWDEAERLTREALEKSGVKFVVEEGGAAHYGPKADIYIRSVIGKEYAIGTDQLDLYMPARFGLTYTDSEGKAKMPYVIHRAPLGSHERMVGFLLEHYAGAFPTWLSPVQVAVLPISEKHLAYAEGVLAALKDAGIRAELDAANESLGKKIRAAKMSKVPYFLVLGDKEMEASTVGVESRDKGQLGAQSLEQFISHLKKEITDRA